MTIPDTRTHQRIYSHRESMSLADNTSLHDVGRARYCSVYAYD